ncbi:MAG: mechanosensitive ion channel family protein [Methanomicrobiaceae archaeon]|nr:mechanosensitive ion channel family protein [Methanomicrobiaceae archaeon]
MLRQVLIFTAALLLAAGLFVMDLYYSLPLLDKLYQTALAFAIIYLIFWVVIDRIGRKWIRESKTRFTFQKAVSIVAILILLGIGARIWVEDAQALLVSYGIIAAGLAIALQDTFKNFVGGIAIILWGDYRVGDRVEIAGVYGDVMDVGLMNTTLMELGEWVDGDQPTGRISIVPNFYSFTQVVHNYTKDHSFIWDEITLPIAYDSDWRAAAGIVKSIIEKETGETSKKADREIELIGERYYLPIKDTEPAIFLTLTDNWIRLNIRFVTDVRSRREMHDRLGRMILEEIEKNPNIRIASTTLEVTGRHTVEMKNPRS